MRIAVVGPGAVGARAARQLHATPEVDEIVLGPGRRSGRAEMVRDSLGDRVRVAAGPDDVAACDAVILATPSGPRHVADLRTLVRRGVAAISLSDDPDDLKAALDLGPEAAERGLPLVLGAGFSPGLSCLLARHAARDLDVVDELHLARAGTGGPACARRHHRALRRPAVEPRDGAWIRHRGGSGRNLLWFPDPVGPRDCYRAALGEPLLLAHTFPTATRVSARRAANRRDWLTARLPMLRPPHPEGLLGAVRVEVRGRRDGQVVTVVLGAVDRPAVAAGTVAALAAVRTVRGDQPVGAAGLGASAPAGPFLAALAERGVRAASYVGE